MQAFDLGGDAFGAGFQLVEAVEYWEPPVGGLSPPENPVPAPDGTLYAAPSGANGSMGMPSENGGLSMVSVSACSLIADARETKLTRVSLYLELTTLGLMQ